MVTAKSEALQHAQNDQDDRSSDADRGRPGQDTDQEGRGAHDQDCHEEGVFAADEIAETAEDQRAERTHQEAGGKGEQGEDIARGFRVLREEGGADIERQRAVKIEIIPFENSAER